MNSAIVLAVLAVLVIILGILMVKSLIIICPPNRVAVISGRGKKGTESEKSGYRILLGGRTIRIPLLEKVSWMDLNTIAIELSVDNAYSKGAIPLSVQAVGNVKVSSTPGILGNAVERLLGRDGPYIHKIAKETLEANLRGVLATLTPEEVNEDRLKFAATLIEEADEDMRTLGLDLDVLKVQNVTDEVGYLDSVGRRRTASVLKEARVTEAERAAEALEAEADGRRRSEIAAVNADLLIVEQENALRVRTALLEAEALAREAEALVSGELAKAAAEQELQQERIELERRRLEADVVAPARARKAALELEAEGQAAKILEDGKAQIAVFQSLVEQYKLAGSDAEKILMMGMLPDLVDKIVSTVSEIDIDKLTVVDSGNGQGVAGVASQMPAAVVKIVEQIETATGVDILSGLARAVAPQSPVAVVDEQ
jgi:flotillin